MDETITCPQGAQELTLPADMNGKPVRCPTCRNVFTAQPTTRAPAPLPPPPREAALSRYRDDYDRPRRQERWEDEDDDEDFRPRRSKRRKRRSGPGHRGGLVLTLGIVSLVLSCAPCLGLICGIIALMVADNDIPEMERGKMDPAGRGMTETGNYSASSAFSPRSLSCWPASSSFARAGRRRRRRRRPDNGWLNRPGS